ncbi:MAG: hypothetical protein SNG35_05055 [Rikenellaceae bacterium]
MKNIRALLLIILSLVGFAACEKSDRAETTLSTTETYEVTIVSLTSGTEMAEDVSKYTVFYQINDLVAWQNDYVTERYNTIDKVTFGINADIDLSFEEVYSGEVTVTTSTGSSVVGVNLRRKFELQANGEGEGTMTITEYNGSSATYSVTVTQNSEYAN